MILRPVNSTMRTREGRGWESGLVAMGLALLLAIVGYDLFRGIPPIGDDYRHALFGPGALYRYYTHLNWGRPLGLFMLDGLHTVAEALHVPVFWPTMFVWFLSMFLAFNASPAS